MNLISLSEVEEKMVIKGYDELSLHDKNRLIMVVSSKINKPVVEITEADILNYHKDIKIQLLSNKCNDKIVEGFTAFNNHTYRLNRDDQINFIGMFTQIIYDESINTVMWKTRDAGYVEHTREDWIAVYREGLEFKRENLFKYNTLKDAVMNATTHKEVVGITWNEGELDFDPIYE